jgi:hypothetical protein
MRSVQSVSSLAHGERFPVAVPDGGVAFGFETIAPVSAETMLVTWSNASQLKAGVYADGSTLTTVQPGAPAGPDEGQWWFEDVGGVPVLVIRHNGVNTVIGTPGGAAVGVTSIAGNSGIVASASTGAVGLSVDFNAVAAKVHTHPYVPLDGSAPMTGPLQTVNGSYSNPALHGTDPDSGIVFGTDFVGFAAAGGLRAKVTPAGFELSNYVIPGVVGVLNSVLVNTPTGVAWTQLRHDQLIGLGDDDHHIRRHHITNTFDHYASPWQTFYSDSNGDIQETGLGPLGYALISAGPSAAPYWGAILAKPNRTPPASAVGYSFADSPNTGMTATAASVFLVLTGNTVLDINLSRMRVGAPTTLIDYPVARGVTGQVLTQQANGVAAWGDLPAAQAAPALDVTAFHRAFMFGRN